MTEITDYIDQMRIIDGHEHLIPLKDRKKNNHGFFDLLHYLKSDMTSAGLNLHYFDASKNEDSIEKKAEVFLEFWEKTKNTTYAKMLKWAVEDLYGMKDWTIEGICELDKKVKQASQDPDLYERILKEKAKIDVAFTLIFTTNVDFRYFRPVMWMDHTFRLHSREQIQKLAKESERSIHSLDDLRAAVEKIMEKYVDEGMVATKIGAAYWRSLNVEKPTYAEAERVFNTIQSNYLKESISSEDAKPLQDFMIHEVIKNSIVNDMPIQIHTGHQEPSVSSNGNILTNSRVTDLVPLLLEYYEAKFVLLHGGMPYHQEYLSIIKNFPNAYADLTWCYILSPTMTKQILFQLIEMVPQSKILGFGGDYSQVEGTYAHAKLAKKVMAEVLSEKIVQGEMTEKEAQGFANLVFRNNLIELYKLDFKKL
ncbi:amidohydrolase family protein [Gracilibacillus salitolerans]|uniref:Amidohydrolase family protein n=1 Tax=Gracilibacillus salitolerans TaxID=2663022 RepID=A0A5Q2TFT1_9BACI|nr:amidohydrolase family protein [Gracilibacillus salitolerans]QGH33659.1 amidohydrolase family protein [Gracilibacillus salitolerans]